MNNRAPLRIKLSREAKRELDNLASNYKGEILSDALNGINDADRECEISAEQLRTAAKDYGRLAVPSDMQPIAAHPGSAGQAQREFRPWLVAGVSILVGACVLITAKLIPIVVRNEEIQVLITLPIVGLFFLLIGAVGRRTQRGMFVSIHLPRLHLPHFHLPRLRVFGSNRRGPEMAQSGQGDKPADLGIAASGAPVSRVTTSRGDKPADLGIAASGAPVSRVTTSRGDKPAVLAPPSVAQAATDRWRSTTDNLRSRSRLLQLSAWLPAALFAASVAMLLQFRSARSTNVLNAVRTLTADPIQALVIIISLLVITTTVTQVFCFAAIKTLEGYWHRRGLASFARTLMIRRQVHKKQTISKRLTKACAEAVAAARPRMLMSGLPAPIANALEAEALGQELPPLSDEQRHQLAETDWRHWCDAWRLAKMDSLINDEMAYPSSSRILPTKLGNLIRATEDTLQSTNGDLQSSVLRRYVTVSREVQIQYDQSRNRLEMYCILVFVSALLVILTPIILLGSDIRVAAIAIISGIFAVLSMASYGAAIASASGYCLALKQMDELDTV